MKNSPQKSVTPLADEQSTGYEPTPIGKTFGLRTVIAEAPPPPRRKGGRFVFCVCRCGAIDVVSLAALRSGTRTACTSCYERHKLHGMTRTPTYVVWVGMKLRCLNPNNHAYDRYGGRGITICEEWVNSFDAFLKDMGPRPSPKHSLDRIDNNAGYTKSNCRWCEAEVQQNNRRNNWLVTFNGRTMTLTQWSRETGLSYGTLKFRINKGWGIERALTTPHRKQKPYVRKKTA